jgi:hypothetical protein
LVKRFFFAARQKLSSSGSTRFPEPYVRCPEAPKAASRKGWFHVIIGAPCRDSSRLDGTTLTSHA